MAGLWSDLSRVLSRLEAIAARPDRELADPDVLDTLPTLQYALHTAAELTLGIDPPTDAEWAHRELASALADARDATADVGELAATAGATVAAVLVPEWRGALFRVRLAQMRLANAPRTARRSEPESPGVDMHTALFATALVLAGTFVVTCGAVLAVWPLWAAGLVLVAGGFVVYRP
jgi:hypothetical protein